MGVQAIYEIYKIVNEGDKKIIVDTFKCKRPSQTQVYKNLELEFDKGNLFAFGFEQISK